jgi:hypothetical protein
MPDLSASASSYLNLDQQWRKKVEDGTRHLGSGAVRKGAPAAVTHPPCRPLNSTHAWKTNLTLSSLQKQVYQGLICLMGFWDRRPRKTL